MELRPELDLVPTLLLLMGVPNVQENLQRVGLVTTRSVQVSIFYSSSAMKYTIVGFTVHLITDQMQSLVISVFNQNTTDLKR